MPVTDETTFTISTKGDVSQESVDRAKERIHRVGTHCRELITHVDLRISLDVGHVGRNQVRAEATVVYKHGLVRARESAPEPDTAVDGMIERLRARLDRQQSKLHRIGTKRHDGVASDGAWHHGDVTAAPRHPQPLNASPGTVVRRKSFATAPMSIEEAAFDLDVLDHDFYLFYELTTGETALLSRSANDRLLLQLSDANESRPQHDAIVEAASAIVPVELGTKPVVLDLAGAQRLLDSDEESFVFFSVTVDELPQVLYRRFDGNYGLIELETRPLSSTSPT